MCSKTVPESMATASLRNASLLNGEFDGVLQVLLGNVVPAKLARVRIFREFRRRKNILPWPGAIGVTVFAFQRERQIDPAAAVREIALMEGTHVRQVQLQ